MQKGNRHRGCAIMIPYLVSADQEGGAAARLSMGTRGTGSMAIGAGGEDAKEEAYAIEKVFGEELSALGINVNLGPCIDVIQDLSDLGMSTRVYGDDPGAAARLGLAFAEGVGESGVITTYKHFPGAGDGSDYPTSIWLTEEELRENGLSAFKTAIDNGAEMLMTSATTFPLLDEEQIMADGASKGFYPATVSPKIVSEILRGELGFDGVVITDALEMEQFVTEPDSGAQLFTGEYASVEHDLQVAQKSIEAGCDILLLPLDLTWPEAVTYYDGYVSGLVEMAEQGVIPAERIEESALRILKLKEKHGILSLNTSGDDLDARVVDLISGAENVGAFNANVPAALRGIFGVAPMTGRLPISLPVLVKGEDGLWSYGEEILYERGFSAWTE